MCLMGFYDPLRRPNAFFLDVFSFTHDHRNDDDSNR